MVLGGTARALCMPHPACDVPGQFSGLCWAQPCLQSLPQVDPSQPHVPTVVYGPCLCTAPLQSVGVGRLLRWIAQSLAPAGSRPERGQPGPSPRKSRGLPCAPCQRGRGSILSAAHWSVRAGQGRTSCSHSPPAGLPGSSRSCPNTSCWLQRRLHARLLQEELPPWPGQEYLPLLLWAWLGQAQRLYLGPCAARVHHPLLCSQPAQGILSRGPRVASGLP